MSRIKLFVQRLCLWVMLTSMMFGVFISLDGVVNQGRYQMLLVYLMCMIVAIMSWGEICKKPKRCADCGELNMDNFLSITDLCRTCERYAKNKASQMVKDESDE